MAETNTYTVDTTPQTETMSDNLTADEQDSLAVGEKLVESQEQLLAGKYKDAQELEKAYVELQKKLGSKDEPTEDVEQTSATEDETEETSLSDGASLITSANDEYYKNDGKLSEETLDKFSSMSSKELVEATISYNNENIDISASGNGPISAFVTAMREKFNLIFRLSDFSQNTRSSGSTAEAAAYVEIRVPDENGRSVFGVGIDTSITLAPIKAVISAINRI